jgi:phage shock protein A
MGIFSRTRDIIAANVTDLLDKAEDPAKMIRMIILEMEETLVEVRASAARTIADQKEMRRHIAKLEKLQESWTEKAELALSKGREDLAKAALVEKQKAGDMCEQLSRRSPCSTRRSRLRKRTSPSSRTSCARPAPARTRSSPGWKAPTTAPACAR